MAIASERGKAKQTTSRGRSAANGSRNTKSSSRGSAQTKNSASARAKNSSSRGRGSSSKRAQGASQSSGASQRSAGSSERDHAAEDGHSTREVLTNAGIGALGAAIGVAGGVLVGRSTAQRGRKLLGISVPTKVDLGGVGQQIGDAGRQFGKLASEVRTVREKAEQIARILN
jgi:hypothetical protein